MPKPSKPSVKTLVVRIARSIEEEHKDELGAIDKRALAESVIDRLDEDGDDLAEVLEKEAVWEYVWGAISKEYRDSRYGMTSTEESGWELEPQLPSLEDVSRRKLTVPTDTGTSPKNLLDCSLWELDATAREYEQQADTLMQHRGYIKMLAAHMRRQGFDLNDKVSKLYKAS